MICGTLLQTEEGSCTNTCSVPFTDGVIISLRTEEVFYCCSWHAFQGVRFFVPCTDGVVLITLHTEEALILPIEVREKEAPHADMMV